MNNPFAQAQADDGYYSGQVPNILICRDCRVDPPNLVEESSDGDVVCADCGLVLADRQVDMRSEWRTFANDDQNHDDPNRVGDAVNPLLNGSQLETSIGSVEPGKGRAARDLHRTQNRTQDSKSNKALLEAYRSIQHHCNTINLPYTVAEASKHIFKLVDDAKNTDAKHLKSKPQEAIIAGCLFVACRQGGVHRTFKDIHQLTRVSKKEIGRVFKGLESFLNARKEAVGNNQAQMTHYAQGQATTAGDLVGRFCSRLGFKNTNAFISVAQYLATQASGLKSLAGRSPLSVAAACIYMASHLLGQPQTSKAIAEVVSVSDGTVKTAYKLLYAAKDALVDMNAEVFQHIERSNARYKKEIDQKKAEIKNGRLSEEQKKEHRESIKKLEEAVVAFNLNIPAS